MPALIMDEHGAKLKFSDGLETKIPLDMANLRRLFAELPPSDGRWEEAVMAVEDAVAPLRVAMPSEKNLLNVTASALSDLAGKMFADEVEHIFQKLSRYGFAAEITERTDAFIQILVVREFLHHMGFAALEWNDKETPL